jgi:CBS domain-containing protein
MLVAAVLKQKGPDVVTASPTSSVMELANTITSLKIGAVVICEGERLAGIVSERDVVKAVSQHGAAALEMTAADIMTRAVKTAQPGTTMDEAMAMMDAGYFRHLPVIDDGVMVGIISVRDVVRAQIQLQAQEVDSLKAYVFRGAEANGLR